jgi:hypothetical protein
MRAAPAAGWFLCAARTEGPAVFPVEGDAHALPISPMPKDTIVQLAAAAADPYLQLQRRDVEVLAERSGGNPLFAIELVEEAAGQSDGAAAASAEALPGSLESAINSTIDTLPAIDRMLLRRAAVLGARVDLAILAAATDEPRDEEKLRWAGLLRFVEWEGGGSISFRHALFRQVAYEGLSYRRRRAIDQRVGEALEAMGPSFEDVNAAQLSLHFDRAGDNGRAWRYSRRAGDAARAGYANFDAAEFFQRALDNCIAVGTVEREALMEVSEALGDVSELAGQYQPATAAYATARRLAEGPHNLCRLLYKGGILREHLGRFALACSACWASRWPATETARLPGPASMRASRWPRRPMLLSSWHRA